jgi:hypothetical protein
MPATNDTSHSAQGPKDRPERSDWLVGVFHERFDALAQDSIPEQIFRLVERLREIEELPTGKKPQPGGCERQQQRTESSWNARSVWAQARVWGRMARSACTRAAGWEPTPRNPPFSAMRATTAASFSAVSTHPIYQRGPTAIQAGRSGAAIKLEQILRHLTQAERHVVEAERRIKDQSDRIAKTIQRGESADRSVALLGLFNKLYQQHLEHRALVRAELSNHRTLKWSAIDAR